MDKIWKRNMQQNKQQQLYREFAIKEKEYMIYELQENYENKLCGVMEEQNKQLEKQRKEPKEEHQKNLEDERNQLKES